MLLHLNVLNGRCMRFSDQILDKGAEYYFTWLAHYDVDDKFVNLAQGFSLGCPLENGYSFNTTNEAYRTLNDPRFTIALPEIPKGQSRTVHIELYLWESDHGSVDVKKAFTNPAAERLWTIWTALDQKKTKVRDEFFEWLEGSDNQPLQELLNVEIFNTTFIKLANAIIPIIKWSIDLVESNGDDLIGVFQADLVMEHTEEGIRYRWIFDNGAEIWLPQSNEDKIYREYEFDSADSKNRLISNILLQTTNTAPATANPN